MTDSNHPTVGGPDRRSYLKQLSLLVAAAGVGSAAGCIGGDDEVVDDWEDVDVVGDTASERAVNAAQQLAEEGEAIKGMIPTGAADNWEAAMGDFEDETGVAVDFETVADVDIYDQTLNQAVTGSDEFDVFMITPRNIPDFTEAGLSLDLTERAQKFRPDLTGPDGVIEPWHLMSMYKERIRLLMAAGDVMHLHLRRDWLEDPDFQAEYEAQYGEQLEPPETVEELDQQIRFFGSMDDRDGGFIYLSPFWSKWTFRRRFIKKGELLWDDDFHPNFDSATGVEVLEELKALRPYLTDNATSASVDEHYNTYAGGNVYATYGWPSMSKFINDPNTSEIASADQWLIARDPGTMIDGELFRAVQFTWGWAFMVNAMSQHPTLSYLFSQYMYSPDVSKTVTAQGYLDPWRKNHLRDGDVMSAFYGEPGSDAWQEYAETYQFNINHSYPELTVEGTEEYYDAIDRAVQSVLLEDEDPETALERAATECEEITEDFGRENQVEQWRFLQSTYAEPIRDALGLPDPPAFIEDV